MSKVFNAEPDFEDGTNVLIGTAYREEELCGRALPWYLPSESKAPANWKEKWAKLRERMERLVDDCQPVICTLVQTRMPAYGLDNTLELDWFPEALLSGRGLEKSAAFLFKIEGPPLSGDFTIRDAKGEPMLTPDCQPRAFRLGAWRRLILIAEMHDRGDRRPIPKSQLAELAHDGTALLYDLPAEVAASVWKNWPRGFSRAENTNEFLWFDALFELSWQRLPGTALSAPRSTKLGGGSVRLLGDGLFPRLPSAQGFDLRNSVPNDGGYPMSWKAKLDDVARASVAAIDEVLERGSKIANVPHQPRSEGSRPTSPTTSVKKKFMKTAKRDKVFVSYSHKDKKRFEEFKTMLAPVVRHGGLDLWDDTKIQPGAKWKEEIQAALASAKVAVLLVSPEFLASEFIARNELPPLLKAAQEEGMTVFWIYVSACLYEQTDIAKYQAAHDISKPLCQLDKPGRQAALSAICARLAKLATTPK